MAISTKEFFTNVDFGYWAEKEKLHPDEKYIIETYLDKDKKTLEAGTGGGRILLEMQNMGFSSLYGYDFVPEFIEAAKNKDRTKSIYFEVQDGTSLTYEESYFDQIIYLQQFISVLETEVARKPAIKEAYRILKQHGTALFSFLSFETKTGGFNYHLYLIYLYIIRKLSASNYSIQYFPYIQQGGKFNLRAALQGNSPYIYRYKLQEAYQDLTDVGFKVTAVGSREQILQGRMYNSIEQILNQPIKGAIFFVCTKLS
jgi:ubiquinone/menaquinone biosynthesis C-methylase UbiE